MTTQYDGRDVAVIFDDSRIEQLQELSTPDESYDGREFVSTLGNDDEDVFLQDLDPDLEGELTVSPTSGSIEELDEALREGTRTTLTVRFPEDHAKDDESYIDTVLTEVSDDDFDGDDEDANNRTYSYIANEVE